MSDPVSPHADDPAWADQRVRPVDLRDYVDFSPDAATRVRVLTSDHLAVDLWCIEPRQATAALHLPDQDVTYTVIGGRSWFVTEEGEIGLDPMGTMLVPAGIVHGIDNRAADPLVVIAVSAPPSTEPEHDPVDDRGAAVHRDLGASPARRAVERVLGVSRRR